jgi:hypothetical protein
MAYVSQEKKAAIAPAVKAALKKYGVKGSLSVNHHSTLVLTLKSGKLDFIGNYNAGVTRRDPTGGRCVRPATDSLDVNVYWYKEHFTGRVLDCLKEVIDAMNVGNHDRSDIQSDYFDVGWYVDVKVGRWNKPYIVQ